MEINKEHFIGITGGTGFLGSHIIRGLIEKGFTNINALKRESSKLNLVEDIKDKVNWIDGDILDIEVVRKLVSDSDYIIHSAAKVSYNPKDKEELFKVNIEGTANIVNACVTAKTKKLIFLSSVAAIGRVKSGVVINEDSEWSESRYNTYYAVSKHSAELEVWRGMVEGLDIGIVNPSLILGPSFWGDSSTKLFTHVIKGSKLHPIGSNGFVDVRDVAQITIALLTSEVKNERFIAVSEVLSYKDVFAMMAKKLNIKAPHVRINKFKGGLAWRIYWVKRMLFGGDPAITSESVRITSGDFIYENEKSKKGLGIEYKSAESSVNDTIEKYLKSKEENKSYAYFDKIFY